MAIGGLDGDVKLARDVLGLQAVGEHADDLGLVLGQFRRALDPRRPLARDSTDGRRGVAVKSPGAGLLAQDL